MNRPRVIYYLICFALLSTILGGLVAQPTALAVSEGITNLSPPPPGQELSPTEEINLTTQYPVLSSYAGAYFSYSIELQYKGGEEPRVFDLKVDVPDGFNYTIAPGYGEGTEIGAIRLEPDKSYPDTINVTVRPYLWLVPEPGEYKITVRASSDDIENSIELKAIVNAAHSLELKTPSGRLNVEATSGDDNYFSIVIINNGSAELENVSFVSKAKDRPSGWSITFNPEEISSLPLGSQREIEVNIKPSGKTIAGDYMVTMEAETESNYAWDNLEVRVTALTPTIWGWVGVGIVIVVIVGLMLMFMRLGRR